MTGFFQVLLISTFVLHVVTGDLQVKTIRPQRVVVDPTAPTPQYKFRYYVKDERTGDYKTQEETREGETVTGSYTVAEPNGDLRTVNYRADKSGFHAIVNVQKGGSPVVIPHPVIQYIYPDNTVYSVPNVPDQVSVIPLVKETEINPEKEKKDNVHVEVEQVVYAVSTDQAQDDVQVTPAKVGNPTGIFLISESVKDKPEYEQSVLHRPVVSQQNYQHNTQTEKDKQVHVEVEQVIHSVGTDKSQNEPENPNEFYLISETVQRKPDNKLTVVQVPVVTQQNSGRNSQTVNDKQGHVQVEQVIHSVRTDASQNEPQVIPVTVENPNDYVISETVQEKPENKLTIVQVPVVTQQHYEHSTKAEKDKQVHVEVEQVIHTVHTEESQDTPQVNPVKVENPSGFLIVSENVQQKPDNELIQVQVPVVKQQIIQTEKSTQPVKKSPDVAGNSDTTSTVPTPTTSRVTTVRTQTPQVQFNVDRSVQKISPVTLKPAVTSTISKVPSITPANVYYATNRPTTSSYVLNSTPFISGGTPYFIPNQQWGNVSPISAVPVPGLEATAPYYVQYVSNYQPNKTVSPQAIPGTSYSVSPGYQTVLPVQFGNPYGHRQIVVPSTSSATRIRSQYTPYPFVARKMQQQQ